MKKIIFRAIVALLVLALLLPFASCGVNLGTPLLTLEANGKTYSFSVNLYELMLSATKGMMVQYGQTANNLKPSANAYWDIVEKQADGSLKTLNELHSAEVLENCRAYLIALCLFDEYGLQLSEEAKEKVEKDLNELVLTDGDGSKAKLNSLLANFGVNYDIMREYYTIKAKIDALEAHIYSTIGESTKNEYLEDNYVHFQQLFVAKFEYVYETDENGDVIYYSKTDNSVCYKPTQYTKTNTDNELVYYTDDTYKHISYDTEKGAPSNKLKADGTGYEVEYLEGEELDAAESRAELLWSLSTGMKKAEFESFLLEESDDADAAAEYTDGYYILKNLDYAASGEDYAYMDTITERFETMEEGEVTLVESTMGFHIVMKYGHTEKAYDKEENQSFFQNFKAGITSEIFDIKCQPYDPLVKLDEKVYATAPDMKKVAVNYFYF